MPEGPEIHRAAAKLSKAVVGKTIDKIMFAFPELEAQSSQLVGRKVLKIEARAKALLTQVEGGTAIYSHNQLYGVWRVGKAEQRPKTGRSLRLEICTGKKAIRLYSASDIELLDAAGIKAHKYLSTLGPDPLAPGVGAKDIENRIREKDVQKKRLGGLLLSQQFIGGIGNYLRSEILFLSGLLPNMKPCDLTKDETAGLAEAICNTMKQSFSSGGITNDLEHALLLKSQGVPRRRYRHWVFGMEGQYCRKCETPIQRKMISGRRLYWCPWCQGEID